MDIVNKYIHTHMPSANNTQHTVLCTNSGLVLLSLKGTGIFSFVQEYFMGHKGDDQGATEAIASRKHQACNHYRKDVLDFHPNNTQCKYMYITQVQKIKTRVDFQHTTDSLVWSQTDGFGLVIINYFGAFLSLSGS